MEGSLILMILLQVVLIALNAIFASAEIAVISFNDAKLARLAAEGDKRAVRLAKLTNQPARFLATIQIAITLSGFLGSAFAAETFSDMLVDWLIGLGVKIPRATLDAAAVVVITLILSYFTLIFGELVPKRVAMRKAESLSLGISGLLSAIATFFAPLVYPGQTLHLSVLPQPCGNLDAFARLYAKNGATGEVFRGERSRRMGSGMSWPSPFPQARKGISKRWASSSAAPPAASGRGTCARTWMTCMWTAHRITAWTSPAWR